MKIKLPLYDTINIAEVILQLEKAQADGDTLVELEIEYDTIDVCEIYLTTT